jgi:tRNA A37 threonylcarbamoyladenosine biosynthesis protein TsaE
MLLQEPDVVRWGNRIGAEVDLPVFIALRGPLGAGKSVLARAIAGGAGVLDSMPSPTFNLLFRYTGRREVPAPPDPLSAAVETAGAGQAPAHVPVEVIHMDLYRLNDPSELWELGWEDLGRPNELILVEWPERAAELLPANRWEITLSPTAPGAQYREVSAARVGEPPHLPGFPVTLHTREDG